MLLMVGAKATVIRTAVMRFCVEFIGRFGRFVVVSNILVVSNIVSNQDFRIAMIRTSFQHEYFFVLKNNFRVNAL